MDDEIIGVKSTSIKFKSMLKKFVSINYSITIIILMLFFFNNSRSIIFLIPLSAFILTLIYQIINFDKRNPVSCLDSFKINNISGFYMFVTFLTLSF